MSYNYIGSVGGLGSLIVKKRQRPKGGSKNVYYLGMKRRFYDEHAQEITRALTQYGGVSDRSPNNYVFTKRPAALKAWTWFVLKYA